MATYAYKAIDGIGSPQKGEIEGVNKTDVMDQLKAMGLVVQALDEKKTGLQMEFALPKPGNATTLTLAKVDPDADFSNDYEDLFFIRVGNCREAR